MQVLTGSTKQACSNETPSGIRTVPLLDNPVHDADIFRETAAGRLKSGGAADFLVGGALGEGLVTAVVALAAGDVVEDYDAIAGRELTHSGANRRDHSRGFVAEDARSGMRSGGDLLQVGATDAAGMDPQQQLSGADLRDGNSFEADVVYSAVNRRQHGGGN